jgi:hypothetical protein
MASTPLVFYLGTHETSWLGRVDVPLMVSRRRIARRGAPRARTRWVLDSGGFTELRDYGTWTVDAATYAREIERYVDLIGPPDWCAPQDWMSEPFMLARTGLTVAEHQARTVGNYLDLRALDAPVIPVLQGWTLADYERCVRLYADAGIDLTLEPTVGLGSVCRRQDTDEIGEIVAALHAEGLALHGFGCKEGAIRRCGDMLVSADSLAWSKGGKERGTCDHLASRCANHLHWALSWRDDVLDAPAGGAVQMALSIDGPPAHV